MNDMQNQRSNGKWSGWWRWPLLPLAATIGATLAAVALTLLQWFAMGLGGTYPTDGWYFLFVMPALSAAVFGWLFILITFIVAPRGKVIAAIVMTALLGVLSLFAGIFIWLNPNDAPGPSIQASVSSIATMVSAYACIVTRKGKYSE